MNITKESLEIQIDEYKKILQKYQNDPEYVNPNCSIERAKELIKRLEKEYHFSYGKSDLEL